MSSIKNYVCHNSKAPLQELLSHPSIWRASATRRSGEHHSREHQYNERNQSKKNYGKYTKVDTGYDVLNEVLVRKGWPTAGLIELHTSSSGIGEWQLLLPSLINKYILLLGPPHIPYAPALTQYGIHLHQLAVVSPDNVKGLLWSAEQALRSSGCEVVLLWEPKRSFKYRELRKLQHLANQYKGLFFLFRSPSKERAMSPAILRINIKLNLDSIILTILKQRAGHGSSCVSVSIPDAWCALPTLSQMPVSKVMRSPVLMSL